MRETPSGRSGRTHRSAGRCILHARVALVNREAAIAQVQQSDSDLTVVRNMDRDVWTDVNLMVSGIETRGINGRQPTGSYSAKRDLLSPDEFTAVKLKN
jgi:hypothetical protein